jgi:hypothetical protein
MLKVLIFVEYKNKDYMTDSPTLQSDPNVKHNISVQIMNKECKIDIPTLQFDQIHWAKT